jgi:hypothetical protein
MASSDYATWCATSAEWAAIRRRVFARSKGWCEACGIARATATHHLTYRFGRSPPLWCLRAVCSDCHDRLHNPASDWCDYDEGMAR